MDTLTAFNASYVIILGFLSRGVVVHFSGKFVGRTGSISSSRIVDSLNTDDKFFTFGLSNVVPLCLFVS